MCNQPGLQVRCELNIIFKYILLIVVLKYSDTYVIPSHFEEFLQMLMI